MKILAIFYAEVSNVNTCEFLSAREEWGGCLLGGSGGGCLLGGVGWGMSVRGEWGGDPFRVIRPLGRKGWGGGRGKG